MGNWVVLLERLRVETDFTTAEIFKPPFGKIRLDVPLLKE